MYPSVSAPAPSWPPRPPAYTAPQFRVHLANFVQKSLLCAGIAAQRRERYGYVWFFIPRCFTQTKHIHNIHASMRYPLRFYRILARRLSVWISVTNQIKQKRLQRNPPYRHLSRPFGPTGSLDKNLHRQRRFTYAKSSLVRTGSIFIGSALTSVGTEAMEVVLFLFSFFFSVFLSFFFFRNHSKKIRQSTGLILYRLDFVSLCTIKQVYLVLKTCNLR